MRHIRNLTICLILIAGMVSCKTTQSAYSLRTGKSVDIQSHITQMPTVADLVVDTVYVSADTTWQNTFSHQVSKEEMSKVLIGKMMEESKADVIIEPRERVVSQREKAFKNNYQMTVSGYPARYRHFRTATEEDMRILNGLQPPTVNNNVIYLGGGMVGINIRNTTAPSFFPKSSRTPRDYKDWRAADGRKRYHGTLDVGYVCAWDGATDTKPYSHGMNINWSNLWFVSKHTMLGIGANVNGLFLNKEYEDSKRTGQDWIMHFYFNPRFYFSRTQVAPFLDMRVGVGFWKENEKTTITYKEYRNGRYYNSTKEEKFSSTEGSIYGALRLGLYIGKHVNVSVGTDIFSIEVSELFESLTVSVGFTF